MLLVLATLACFGEASSNYCTMFYGSDCQWCVSHYADQHCGFFLGNKTCISWDDASSAERGAMLYGPQASCSSETPSTPVPTPEPTAAPGPIVGDECGLFADCDECSLHYADRNCGWCAENNKCMKSAGEATKCPANKFYYNNNAKCGEKIPDPVEPWPRYDANATFCISLSGDWCEKCVSTNVSYSCGWCHTTNECIQGDAIGPLFGTCEDWSFVDADGTPDDKCLGLVSKGTRVAIRVTVAIVITVITALCVAGCAHVIRKPKVSACTYDEVQ